MNDLLITFLISSLSAMILAFPIYRGLIALKSRQNVSQYVEEHAHKQGTPTMGGLIILAGALPGLAYWTSIAGLKYTLPTIVLVVGYALIGFIDDFVLPRMKKGSRGISWVPKLFMQIGIAGIAVWLGTEVFSVSAITTYGLKIFLILFFANAYNFSDGLDWLAGSLLLLLGAGLTAFALRTGRAEWAFPLIGFLGGLLPFMMLNRPPARVFMGDVGSMAIGGMLGLVVADIGLYSTWTGVNHQALVWLGLAVLSVVMIIELVPVPLQILSVKLRKKRLFPMTPIHHAFQKAGWPESKIVTMFFVIQALGVGVGFWLITLATG